MAATAIPTYALVGEATMDGSDFPTGLSWKRGFFTNQSQGQYTHLVPAQAKAKRNSKIQCPPVEKRQHNLQWSTPMSVAVPRLNTPTMAISLAPAFFLNDTPATVLSTEQHD